MERSKWWHAAVAAVTALLTVLVILSGEDTPSVIGALGCLALFAGGWLVVGRHAWRSPRSGVVYSLVIVVASGLGTAFAAPFATIQFIAFTLVWTMAPSVRTAVGWNIALTVAVLTGFCVSVGTEPADLLQSITIEGISLGFSLAFGLWIVAISERSEERQRLLDELTATQERLAAVNRDAGTTAERERLARELHDTLAQDLTGLVMLAERVRTEMNPATRSDLLALLEENARAALAETRSLVAASAPVDFEHGGLGDALRRLGARFQRETGVAVIVTATGLTDTARDTEVVLLRSAQEGLANVRKHAAASRATIDVVSSGDGLQLVIADDGRGFDADAATTGFGLPGLRDRLALVGGTLEVRAAPGGGTTITVHLPVSVRT